MKIILLIGASVLQILMVIMFVIKPFWLLFLFVGYALSLGCLIYLLLKDRRKMEEEERNDDDRHY
ncbi:hypothetical protein [Bacillus sp. RAR_GA_16]|uniref:hypothetical protein n=1 Tax=Bacillus sp. RAR_GA_16 TaxID=2876774 RepID=UPI001CC95E5C|nr:hypothetical protein [Bacillus sp. RAR_GA_16]MCA0171084.1 hypothetical protein [Bacillus sp. RAR_GA_16]